MRPSDIMLAVPTRGSVRWATVTRLEEIRDRAVGLGPIVYQPGNLSVALTRNKIVRRFLESGCGVLAMVDDDVVPPPHFLDLADKLDGFGMLAVPHPMPSPDGRSLIFTVFEEADGGVSPIAPAYGLHECDAVATGAVVVSREALEAVGEDPFRMEHRPGAEVTSDDFLFCRALRDAGQRVGYWWDGWYCDHHSTVSLAPLVEEMVEA